MFIEVRIIEWKPILGDVDEGGARKFFIRDGDIKLTGLIGRTVEVFAPNEREVGKSDCPSLLREWPAEDIRVVDPLRRPLVCRSITRQNLVNSVLDALLWMQAHIGSLEMASDVKTLLATVHRMDDELLPDDPLLEWFYALRDTLICEERWAGYIADQFARAREILQRISLKKPLPRDVVEAAIMELKKIGFNTTP